MVMTPTERAAVAEAIAALEQVKLAIFKDEWAKALQTINTTLASLRSLAPAPADKDPTASAEWNEGVDLVMMKLCAHLGVDPEKVRWDAATETADGDVAAVIGNIFTAKFGEAWSPDAPADSDPDGHYVAPGRTFAEHHAQHGDPLLRRDDTWAPTNDCADKTVPEMLLHIYSKRQGHAVAPNGHTCPFMTVEEWSRIADWVKSLAPADQSDAGRDGVIEEIFDESRKRFERDLGFAFDLKRAEYGDGYLHDGISAMWSGWERAFRHLQIAVASAPSETVGRGEASEYDHRTVGKANFFGTPDGRPE